MKKLILTLCIAFTMQMFATAATVDIQQLAGAVPGTINVAVNSNFSDVSIGVSAFQFDITFDSSVLTFAGGAGAITNSAFAGAETSLLDANTLRVLWSNNSTPSQLVGKMFDLVFTYKGGSSNLSFIPANCTITASGALPITATYTNGWVHMVTPSATITMANVVSQTNTVVNIPVTANQLYDIGGFDFSMTFANPAVVSGGTITIANVNPALVANIVGGNFDTGSGLYKVNWAGSIGNHVSLANGTKLFDIRFTYTSGSSAITFNTGTSYIFDATNLDFFTGVTYTNGSISEHSAELTLFLEGLYNSGTGLMNKAKDYVGAAVVDKYSGDIADHVTVELHSSANYATIVYTAADVSLGTNGVVGIDIPDEYSGSYFITIKHRNHIETTSKNPISLSTRPISYDFTSSADKAYGNNLRSMGNGKYGIFGGDVNGDGFVNGSDLSSVNFSVLQLGKGYVVSDINGDGLINGTDLSAVNFSVLQLIQKKNP